MILALLFSIAGYSPFLFVAREAVITQEMCTANGVPNLFHQLQNEYEEASKCSTSDLLLRLINGDDLNAYYRSQCTARSKAHDCTAKALSLSKQCLNTQNIKQLETWEKIDEQLLDYICNNYYENLSAFNQKEIKCWEGINNVLINNCSQKIYKAMHTGSYLNMNKFTHSDLEDFEMCLRHQFPKYCNEQIRDIVLTAIKIISSNLDETTTNHINKHKRLRRSVILRRIVREIGVANKLHKIEHKVKNLCISNGHASQKLEDTLEKMKKCTEEKQMFLVPKHEYLHHMEKCSNESIELFESCLPEKYKYLPPLFFKIVESMISFLYDDFIIISSELGPCIPKLNSKKSTEEYNKCVDKILIEDELVDSKEKFCQNWISINACYTKQIQKDCKHSDELTKFENDFTEAITKPCKSKPTA